VARRGLLALLLAGLAAAARGEAAAPQVVAIDAGHGGVDQGAVIRGRVEKKVVLDISEKIAARLSRGKTLVPFLTRRTDVFVPLSDRVLNAEAAGGRAFVSIHVDKVYGRKGRGAILYVYGANRRMPDGPARGPEERILPSPPQSQIARSKVLAESLRAALKAEGIKTVRYVDLGGFAVLKSSVMPSVILEVGNLRDEREAVQMCRPEFQERLARAVARGLERFLAPAATRARE